MGQGLMWERSHRPRHLSEVALNSENRRTLGAFVARRDIPRDLILVGGPGRGKSTVAEILERELAFDHHLVIASGRAGVDEVRGRITEIVNAGSAVARLVSENPQAPYRIIRLEEAQFMSTEALAALRTVIDQRPDSVRFLLTGNAVPRDAAVVDRCQVVLFSRPPVLEMVAVLKRVIEAEGYRSDRPTMLACARAFESVRRLIGYAEKCCMDVGHLEPPQDVDLAPQEAPWLPPEDFKLLQTVREIVSESGRPRLRTKEILRKLGMRGDSSLTDLDEDALADRLRPAGVKPSTFTDRGAKSARGYKLDILDAAVRRLGGE